VEAAPVINKYFGLSSIAINGVSPLTIVMTNPAGNIIPLTGVAFVDPLPAGLVVATPSSLTTSCASGSVTAAPGSSSISMTGATIPVNDSCQVTVNVMGTASGTVTNITNPVTSTNGATGNAATASITVTTVNLLAPPVIGEAFSPAIIAKNANSTLTYTITNPAANTLAITGLSFNNGLPSGLVVATPNGVSGSCGGTVTAVAGASSIALTGGTLGVGANCSIAVSVTGTAAGTFTNSVTAVSGNAGTGNTANATLTVTGTPGPQNFQQIGVFRSLVPGASLGTFALDPDGNFAFDGADKFRQFGLSGDQPVAGDWFGTGIVSLGVFRCPAAGVCSWYIDANNNGTWDGVAGGDAIWNFGITGDQAIVGDWTGDGISKIGVMRCPPVGTPGVCTWYMDAGNKHAYDAATVRVNQYGIAGDIPVANNWNGTGNIDQIGVFRCPTPGVGVCTWIVNSTGTGVFSASDAQYQYGLTGDRPIVGNWQVAGSTTTRKRIGVFRGGQVILNVSGSNAFVLGSDFIGNFGLPGDLPVIGFWTMP
jgi:hypothetical protein